MVKVFLERDSMQEPYDAVKELFANVLTKLKALCWFRCVLCAHCCVYVCYGCRRVNYLQYSFTSHQFVLFWSLK